MAPTRRTRGRTIAVFLALAGALAAAEITLRVSGYDPSGRTGNSGHRHLVLRPSETPALVYEPTPGAQGRLWDSDVHINRHGFRDRERTLEKAPGTWRVIGLGDSITFGNRLPAEATWPRALEDLALERGRPLEALNLGVGGYDTAQEVAFLEAVGLQFEFDQVVLAMCVNDIATVSVNLEELGRAARLRSGWLRHTRLGQWCAVRFGRRSLREEMEARREAEVAENGSVEPDPAWAPDLRILNEFLQRNPPGDEVLSPEQIGLQTLEWYSQPARIARVREPFRRLARLADEHDFEVIVFVVPFLEEPPTSEAVDQAEAWRAVYRILAGEAERHGFRTVDVEPALRAAGLADLRKRPKDPIHPDARGHRLLAETLLDAISSTGARD